MTETRLIEELQTLAKQARQELCDISAGRKKWRMSVPVQQDDSDMLFDRLADAAEQAAALLSADAEPPRLDVQRLADDIDFSIDITEPRETRIARFVELITHALQVGGADAEPPQCGVVGEPEAGRMVCELPAGHEGYHQQGGVCWLGYHPKGADAEPSAERATEWEAAKLRAYRQARIWEPNMDAYNAAMSVYAAAFGKPDGEPSVVLPDGSTKQPWELAAAPASSAPAER